jgi:hypothetical protein
VFEKHGISLDDVGIMPTAAADMQLLPCRRAGMGSLIIAKGGRRDA